MALERMQVTNHERWGNLVKTWSTGKNYLDDDNDYPIPNSVEEFKAQLAKAQVFMSVPDRFTKVNFVEQHLDTIVVRLPPAQAIADSEEKLLCLIGLTSRKVSNAINRKPSATQTVAQGFPSLLYADRMSLHHPTRRRLVGRSGRSNPE